MRVLYKGMVVIIFCGILTGCIGADDDEIDSEGNNQDKEVEEQAENKPEQGANDREREQQEPNKSKPPGEAKESGQKSNESEEPNGIPDNKKNEVVLENEAFQIFEPVPGEEVSDPLVVKGLARVFEGTVQYEFEDGHFIIDQGFVTASKGGPEWGEFEIIIELNEAPKGSYRIILYEESAKDGSRIHELMIPVDVSE